MRVHPGQYKGLSTFLTHYTELENAENAHIAPIYQNSVFIFEDTTSAATISGSIDWKELNFCKVIRWLKRLRFR